MRVGVDVIEIERVRQALERYAGFAARCFTEAERAYCDGRGNPAQHYAARFAAKEAVGKALGSGFEGEPRPGAARLIEQMNELGAPVLAVDLPSGIDASTGEVAGAAVDADLTVTFHGEKVGHHVTPGGYLVGYVEVADIGLEPMDTEHARVTREILELVPRRGPEDTKYTAGDVVGIGGPPRVARGARP